MFWLRVKPMTQHYTAKPFSCVQYSVHDTRVDVMCLWQRIRWYGVPSSSRWCMMLLAHCTTATSHRQMTGIQPWTVWTSDRHTGVQQDMLYRCRQTGPLQCVNNIPTCQTTLVQLHPLNIIGQWTALRQPNRSLVCLFIMLICCLYARFMKLGAGALVSPNLESKSCLSSSLSLPHFSFFSPLFFSIFYPLFLYYFSFSLSPFSPVFVLSAFPPTFFLFSSQVPNQLSAAK